MVKMIAREIGSRALIVSMPPMLAYQAVRVLGWMVGDVINTSDEVSGRPNAGKALREIAPARHHQAQ
jgi:hypothetical protein